VPWLARGSYSENEKCSKEERERYQRAYGDKIMCRGIVLPTRLYSARGNPKLTS
jgi:hypothetical protein